LYIKQVRYDNLGRPSQRFIGKYATVNVNPTSGTIVTIWPTSTKKRMKYSRGGK
jgi:hypothetical protein